MKGKNFWLILAGVAAVHVALFGYLANSPIKVEKFPRVQRSTTFRSAEKTFRDPATGDEMVIRQYTVSTKMQDRPPGELGSPVAPE